MAVCCKSPEGWAWTAGGWGGGGEGQDFHAWVRLLRAHHHSPKTRAGPPRSRRTQRTQHLETQHNGRMGAKPRTLPFLMSSSSYLRAGALSTGTWYRLNKHFCPSPRSFHTLGRFSTCPLTWQACFPLFHMGMKSPVGSKCFKAQDVA